MTQAEAIAFAEDWIDSWNSHDLDRIMVHYDEDFEMMSPLIIERMNEPGGVLKGRARVREYWKKGLESSPGLRFEMKHVLAGVRGLTIVYANHRRQLAAETLIFGDSGKVISGNAQYADYE